MDFKLWERVLNGNKTQARRPVRPGDYAIYQSPDNAGSSILFVHDRNGRLKWGVGYCYTIQPKRGTKGLGAIRILSIRREFLQSISLEDCIREGISMGASQDIASRIIQHHPRLGPLWADDPGVWVLTFELATPKDADAISSMAVRRLNERRQAMGMCITCGRTKPKAGCQSCEECLARMGQNANVRREKNIAAGMCARCGTQTPAANDKECETCRDIRCARVRQWRKRQRLDVLEHYGGLPPRCACCGESRLEFLAIDHIEGGGKQHRLEIGMGGGSLERWLKNENYPLGFRVLCHNCNSSLGYYGYCPHNLEKEKAHE